MSEHIVISPERHEQAPSAEKHETHKTQAAHEKHHTAKKINAHEARKAVAEHVRSDAQTNPLERLRAAENASEDHRPTHINRELKSITLRRELQHIRRKLPAPQRALSRVIHQPAVRAISETAGKTVSRPSGLLGGGLVGLLGTSSYLYLAKYMGFEYNYGVFLVLFASGFVLGLALELAVNLATASHRKNLD